MAIKISKLFRDHRFKQFDNTTKLLFIYLATHPDLQSVGVVAPDLEVTKLEVGVDDETLRQSAKELVKSGYGFYVKEFEGVIYFILPDHFKSLPKSQAVSNKAAKELEELPSGLVKFLSGKGVSPKYKITKLKKPTAIVTGSIK